MVKKVIVGGIIGAIIAFAWSFVSWSILPWHTASMHKFVDEEMVISVVKHNAPKGGVYVAPFCNSSESSKTRGPLIFSQVNLKGMNPSNPFLYIFSFFTQFIAAVLVSWLLMQTACSYGRRVLFVGALGLLVGVLGFLPGWSWFGAGAFYTLVMIADVTIGWFLVGVILAAFVKPKRAMNV